jgi:hypothetical protein
MALDVSGERTGRQGHRSSHPSTPIRPQGLLSSQTESGGEARGAAEKKWAGGAIGRKGAGLGGSEDGRDTRRREMKRSVLFFFLFDGWITFRMTCRWQSM